MDNSSQCKSCKKRALIADFATGNMVCSLCGTVQSFDNFEHSFGGLSGPTGTFIKTGTAGAGTNYSYKETKIYKAIQELELITSLLDISDSKKTKVKDMVDKITEGEFGTGNWLPILICACSYVVMRKDEKPISLAEVASKVGYDIHELGRMVNRVVNFLELKLPEHDVVGSFERGFRTCFSVGRIDKDIIDRMMKQGIFLVQCLVKWWLTTGRRPLPIVVAVLVFVAQLNQVDVSMNDMANKLHVAVPTCRLRYKELLERLVEVAQASLPWGKDINVKNILKNAPFVIQYMELKSMSKKNQKGSNPNLFDLDDLVGDCLGTEVEYGVDNIEKSKDAKYFELEYRSSSPRWNAGDMDELKLSHESLSLLYTEFSNDVLRETRSENIRKRREDIELIPSWDWWNGKSELSKKLILKKILEKDIGLDPEPPSFVSGCLENSLRREKIKAAKLRIAYIMNPSNFSLTLNDKPFLEKCTCGAKKRKRRDVDWEDFIIETLLLHRVKEEEIEKGHYNTLLDLYVFN